MISRVLPHLHRYISREFGFFMLLNRLQGCSLLDEQDCQGKTPLHLAVEGGFSPVIEALVEAGADLNIQTNDGKTCLHLVVILCGGPENPDQKVQTTNGFGPVTYYSYELFKTNILPENVILKDLISKCCITFVLLAFPSMLMYTIRSTMFCCHIRFFSFFIMSLLRFKY